MKITEIKEYLIKDYIKRLDKNSKWFSQDIADYKKNLNNADANRIMEMYNNISYLNSAKCEEDVRREENKMQRAGMYNIGNMQPKNALD